MQHPFGHDAALHTHAPCELQVCPVGHAAHAAPLAPHDVGPSLERDWHEPLLQQPGHDVPPHAHAPVDVSHASPDAHALHAAPPFPHSVDTWFA